MPNSAADRNLLFGVVALLDAYIDNNQFAEICAAWATRKSTPLADLLLERAWLTVEDRKEVERVVERHLRRHGGDVRAGLQAVADERVKRSLAGVPDDEVRQSLVGLAPAGPLALLETVPPSADSRDGERY